MPINVVLAAQSGIIYAIPLANGTSGQRKSMMQSKRKFVCGEIRNAERITPLSR
jgi:hypothetical protein